jgi:hypothetical protein
MRDEQEIQGTWIVKFRKWTWEYKFAENKSVRWRDIHNNENGSGRWYKGGNLVNISWTGSTTKESWSCPINPDKQGCWIDASYGVGKAEAVRIEKVVPGELSFDYDVGKVPILRQGARPVCWAAAVSMMIGWRTRNMGISIAEAMNTLGEPFISLYRDGKGLSDRSYLKAAPNLAGIDPKSHLASRAGLKAEPLRSYTPQHLYELMLRNRSPLMVEAHWDDQWTHAYVIKRISGNGRRGQTSIYYNDPNYGEEEQTDFEDLMKQLEGAVNQTTIQVMHY